MFYRLPRFVSETLASQPSPSRKVTLTSVAGAVLAGIDCAIYLVVGVFLGAMGWRSLSLNLPLIAPVLFAGGAALLVFSSRYVPRAAIGVGQTGRYYMQQSWALALGPGDTLWILRLNGRDVLYVPTSLKRQTEAI